MNQPNLHADADRADTLLASIARSNVQLYNQLQAQNRPSGELRLIRRAYELTSQLYSGAYQADDKPFVMHVVAVASVLVALALPSEMIAAALLHNVYNNADFGDGVRRTITPRRRARVIDAVGERVEYLVRRFAELRLDRNLDRLLAEVERMDQTDRQLITMDLADLLEKHLDLGVLYFGQNRWVTGFVTTRIADLETLAARLGHPLLGEALAKAVDTVQRASIDPVLRSADDRKYLCYKPPLSYRLKWPLRIAQRVRSALAFRWVRAARHRLTSRT